MRGEFAPEPPAYSRASLALNWGNLELQRGQIDDALTLFDRGIGWSEGILSKNPHDPIARELALKLHGSKANTYDACKHFSAAVKEWQRVVELAEGSPRLEYRMRRSVSLARSGDSPHAVAEADALAAEPGCSPDIRYNCACVLALSGRAEKAVALLSKLQKEGYFQKEEMLKELRTDSDLDSLRKRDDFAQLVNSLAK
jgi:tetratricopeptide (TPR) repeat protein